MSRRLEVLEKGKSIYDIWIEKDYQNLSLVLEPLDLKEKKVCIVADTNSVRYSKEVLDIVKEYAKYADVYTIPSGEVYKNLDTVKGIYQHAIEIKLDRNDFFIALGGGVVGDLTGFAAATFLRGISCIQMPTTLLSMVDSSIGGKTGVDFLSYKNMVGAFHQPAAVYINLNTLHTLSERQYNSGYGEVIKYGLIRDREFYLWLWKNHNLLRNKDSAALEEMVYQSCRNKQIVVEHDPLEKGERAILNFGHTLGHAIEKYKDFTLLHGECVSIGMAAACFLSMKKGYITQQECMDIGSLLECFSLPVSVTDIEPSEVLAITKNDKKMSSGKIKFIILKELGKAMIEKTVTEKDMREALLFLTRQRRVTFNQEESI